MWGRDPPNMRITLGWARSADNVADVLRRGAWYPVVEDAADGHVVVEVRRQRIRLNRADVTVRTEPPDHWSVVVRTGVLRPTLGGKGMEVVTTYAVCPLCHYRQDFAGKRRTAAVCTRTSTSSTAAVAGSAASSRARRSPSGGSSGPGRAAVAAKAPSKQLQTTRPMSVTGAATSPPTTSRPRTG